MNHTFAPPSKLLWAAEVPRALGALAQHAIAQGALAAAPRGDGRPVVILPGLGNPDASNLIMRRYLNRLGYRARGWGLGFNLGARSVGAGEARLEAMLSQVMAETGEDATLIGISLGGIMARLAAHRWPDLVREVITVSAPYAGDPRATNVWRAFEWLTGERIDDERVRALRDLVASPLPVPSTAIWSASDGLVNGALCRGPDCRAIEVRSSHLLVQSRPEVMLAVARVLGEGSERKQLG